MLFPFCDPHVLRRAIGPNTTNHALYHGVPLLQLCHLNKGGEYMYIFKFAIENPHIAIIAPSYHTKTCSTDLTPTRSKSALWSFLFGWSYNRTFRLTSLSACSVPGSSKEFRSSSDTSETNTLTDADVHFVPFDGPDPITSKFTSYPSMPRGSPQNYWKQLRACAVGRLSRS